MTTQRQLLSLPIRIALALFALIVGGFFGQALGEFLGYAIARFADRDAADLKDMLIWCVISGMATGAAAGVWLVLVASRSQVYARRAAMIIVCGLAAVGAALIALTYDWPKSSGHPLVEYELRLPTGLQPPRNEIRLTTWRDKTGHGVYMARIRTMEDRVEIAGNFVLPQDSTETTMSLGLPSERGPPYRQEQHWRLPFAGNARLDKDFGPWQRIEFLPSHSSYLQPLPPGDYDIRYRVRRYR
jgi:hypothetical protein